MKSTNKKLSLLLVSAMLCGILLPGCSGTSTAQPSGSTTQSSGSVAQPSSSAAQSSGFVTQPSGSATQSSGSVISSDPVVVLSEAGSSVNANGDPVQSYSVDTAQVQREKFVVLNETVTLDENSLVQQIVTQAAVWADALGADATNSLPDPTCATTHQAAAALSALENGLLNGVNGLSDETDGSILEVTLTYQYTYAADSFVPVLDSVTVSNGSLSATYTPNGGVWAADDPEDELSRVLALACNVIAGSGSVDTALESMGQAALQDVDELVKENTGIVTHSINNIIVISDPNGNWAITRKPQNNVILTYLQSNKIPTDPKVPFVQMDAKGEVASGSVSTITGLQRRVEVEEADGTAAAVLLNYIYSYGQLTEVTATATEADKFDHLGAGSNTPTTSSQDTFVVNKSGDLVYSSASTNALLEVNGDEDSSGGATLSGGSDTIGDSESEKITGPIRNEVWAALIGEANPSEDAIIRYVLQSKTEAIQSLASATRVANKLAPLS